MAPYAWSNLGAYHPRGGHGALGPMRRPLSARHDWIVVRSESARLPIAQMLGQKADRLSAMVKINTVVCKSGGGSVTQFRTSPRSHLIQATPSPIDFGVPAPGSDLSFDLDSAALTSVRNQRGPRTRPPTGFGGRRPQTRRRTRFGRRRCSTRQRTRRDGRLFRRRLRCLSVRGLPRVACRCRHKSARSKRTCRRT
jgi:hypothetical protein